MIFKNAQPHQSPRRTLGTGGWMLTEMMMAVLVGTLFMVSMVSAFVTSSLSFASMGNYINMDRSSRNALDQMSRRIRSAKSLTSFSSTVLTFNFDSAGTTNLTYRYDSSSALLTEEWTVAGATTVNTLLQHCDSLAFSLFTRDLTPTTDTSAGQGKLISVAWRCSGTVLGKKVTNEDMQQAQIVIRNQL